MMKTGWFSILLEEDYDGATVIGEDAWLLDPVDDAEEAERLGRKGQGLSQTFLLRPEDIQAILDGKVLVLSVHSEYMIVIGINHDQQT